MSQLFFRILLLFLTAFSIFSAESAEKNYRGRVVYPDTYKLIIYRPRSSLPEEKQYLTAVIKSLLVDRLKIQKEAQIPDILPDEIYYPYPALKKNSEAVEDPYSIITTEMPPGSQYAALEVSSTENRPDQLQPDAFHLMTTIGYSENKLNCRLQLSWGSRVLSTESITFDEEDTVLSLKVAVDNLRKVLSGDRSGAIAVFTTPDGASVYLNGMFAGSTPLEFNHLPPVEYDLKIQKRDYTDIDRRVKVTTDATEEIRETLKKESGKGYLFINSKPDGASVFLGVEYKGRTPLKLTGLPLGLYRIRVSHEGYIDRYRTVTLTEKYQGDRFNFSLDEGDTIEFYNNRQPGILGVDYYTLFTATTFFSAVSGATAVYFMAQRDYARDVKLTGLSTTNPDLYTQADIDLINRQNSEMNRYNRLSQGFLAGAAVSLVASVYFFSKYLETGDPELAASQGSDRGSPVSFSYTAGHTRHSFVLSRSF